MTVLATCPACGFESPEVRCPRCNALKVVGCSGSCSVCGSSCKTGSVPRPTDAPLPSDDAIDDDEHPGTPLT
ncbi:MAG: hypothetical protein HGB10_10895 [Coriobacteriia bacterium]|nr:hypothetical protein [Coriobacteriia bacterium]